MPVSTNKKISLKGLAYHVELNGYSPSFKYLWRTYLKGCLQRDIIWGLTPEQFEGLLSGDCYYCGRPPFNYTKAKTMLPLLHNGVDRVDNDLPYTEGNSVSCCKFCNSMKSNLSEGDFINHIFMIANHQVQGPVYPARKPHKAKVAQLKLFPNMWRDE